MNTGKKKFVFTTFETIQYVNFDKLEKICDKLFVLVHQQEQHIPLSLVLSMQEMGKDAKWVVVRTDREKSLNFHMSYVFGKLDEKLSEDIEFVLLSEDDTLDALIDFINLKGRSCIRVIPHQNGVGVVDDEDDNFDVEHGGEMESDYHEDYDEDEEDDGGFSIDLSNSIANNGGQTEMFEAVGAVKTVDDQAKETVERLKYTGNRPAEVLLLKDYISLFHQGIDDDGQADQIINKLVENQQIEIRKGTIIYNF